jgi:hypothetical protein
MNRLMPPKAVMVGVFAAAAYLAVFGDTSGLTRTLLTLPFLLVAPGLAWLNRPARLDLCSYIVLAIALSLAFDIVIASVFLFLSVWSPEAVLGDLLAMTGLGLICTARSGCRVHSRAARDTTTGTTRQPTAVALSRRAADFGPLSEMRPPVSAPEVAVHHECVSRRREVSSVTSSASDTCLDAYQASAPPSVLLFKKIRR